MTNNSPADSTDASQGSTTPVRDVIIIGSGAGGSAAAYRLAKAGKRILIVEKGEPLAVDGRTLDRSNPSDSFCDGTLRGTCLFVGESPAAHSSQGLAKPSSPPQTHRYQAAG